MVMSNRGSDVREFLAWQRELGGSFVPLDEPASGFDDRGHEFVEIAPAVAETMPRIVAPEPPARGVEREQTASAYDRIEALIAPASPLLHMRSLEEVSDYVRQTVLLPIDETRKRPVPGVGNPRAGLMVVGEAPGADEDRLGEPFVGKAGMLLTKILAAIDFRREEVFIANILKSRPPENRDPQPHEVAAHIPILYKQIALIRPKLILCVGRIAGSALLGRPASLKDLRGRFHDFHGLPVLVTYHPAALLRNPQWKRPTWEDVQMLRARYDELIATT